MGEKIKRPEMGEKVKRPEMDEVNFKREVNNMKRIIWFSIIGVQEMTGSDEEIRKKAEELDDCDILYIIEPIDEKD